MERGEEQAKPVTVVDFAAEPIPNDRNGISVLATWV